MSVRRAPRIREAPDPWSLSTGPLGESSAAGGDPGYLARVDAREQRLASNEILFREVNERIEHAAGTLVRDDHVFEFLCECSNLDCTLRLPLTLRVYETARREPTTFIVAPGHDLPEIEQVVARGDGYQVVRKQGGAAELVTANDPRS